MGKPISSDPPTSSGPVEPFGQALRRHNLTLSRKRARTLQVNVGLVCDLSCRHCHLMAGPHRREIMTAETMAEVVRYARRGRFELVDVTGGAPELVPGIASFISELADAVPTVMLRSNLTALDRPSTEDLIATCLRQRVALVVSFPGLREAQVEAQRGSGVWRRSLATLQRLNRLGYGQNGTGLELHLAINPGGAFLPAGQAELEKRYRQELERRWGIAFNHLFTLTNMPLGRFRRWLEATDNYESYLRRLARAFNPQTVAGLMCREQVTVSWEGFLFDCDFNLAAGICQGERLTHVRDARWAPPVGTPIATGEHCYACSAGSGFT